jgi:hypothetical protein
MKRSGPSISCSYIPRVFHSSCSPKLVNGFRLNLIIGPTSTFEENFLLFHSFSLQSGKSSPSALSKLWTRVRLWIQLISFVGKLHSLDQYRSGESSIIRSVTTQRRTMTQKIEARPCVYYSNNNYLYRSLIRGCFFKHPQSHTIRELEVEL